MQYRLHYFRRGGKRIDLLLGLGDLFIGQSPPQSPRLEIAVPFLPETHLIVNVKDDGWTVKRVAAKIPDEPYETKLNDRPLESEKEEELKDQSLIKIIGPNQASEEAITLVFERSQELAPPAPLDPETKPAPIGLPLTEFFCENSQSQKLLAHLPEIYQPVNAGDTFLARYLRIFEALLLPLEWTVDHFALFLDPVTTPLDFLPWLEHWFQLDWDWGEERRRLLLQNAPEIFSWRGTAHGLSLLLAIYLYGKDYQWRQYTIDIDETTQSAAFTFRVKVEAVSQTTLDDLNLSLTDLKTAAKALIDAYKPLHTTAEFDWK